MTEQEINRLFELHELLSGSGQVDVELEMEYTELHVKYDEENN